MYDWCETKKQKNSERIHANSKGKVSKRKYFCKLKQFPQNKHTKKNIKADGRFQKSKHCAGLWPPNICGPTRGNKRDSKQVNQPAGLFTFRCSSCSAEKFDLFLLYIPQCHKHNAVSRSFKGPSVTGSGGEDQIFISQTQNGNLNEIQWKQKNNGLCHLWQGATPEVKPKGSPLCCILVHNNVLLAGNHCSVLKFACKELLKL